MIDALVLAGSRNDGPLKQCSSVPYEAMITIGRKTMVDYVIDALRSSQRIGRIVVLGPTGVPGFCQRDDVKVVTADGGMLENVARGVQCLKDSQRILLATCDIPLITSRAIEDFLDRCGQRTAEIYYPVVPREAVEKTFNNVERTYFTLREGEFTGGNLFLIDPSAVSRCMDIGQQVVDARKSPLRMSRLLGIPFLLRFVLKRVSLQEAQEKASALLGVKGVVVVTTYPEVGVDVDKPSDLELVCRVLG
jgi:GTP:adenosylcobinamide-phosphate guanylyltransferase